MIATTPQTAEVEQETTPDGVEVVTHSPYEIWLVDPTNYDNRQLVEVCDSDLVQDVTAAEDAADKWIDESEGAWRTQVCWRCGGKIAAPEKGLPGLYTFATNNGRPCVTHAFGPAEMPKIKAAVVAMRGLPARIVVLRWPHPDDIEAEKVKRKIRRLAGRLKELRRESPLRQIAILLPGDSVPHRVSRVFDLSIEGEEATLAETLKRVQADSDDKFIVVEGGA